MTKEEIEEQERENFFRNKYSDKEHMKLPENRTLRDIQEAAEAYQCIASNPFPDIEDNWPITAEITAAYMAGYFLAIEHSKKSYENKNKLS